MKNKLFRYSFFTLIFILMLILVWLLISSWPYLQKNKTDINENQYPTARESVDWDAPLLQKIEVEFMNKTEKEKMNLADDPAVRLQVLERDESGKITAYKKIYRDEDIIEYVRNSNLMPVATSTEPITKN